MGHLIYIIDTSAERAEMIKEKLGKNDNQIEIFSAVEQLSSPSEQNVADLLIACHPLPETGTQSRILFEKIPTIIFAGEMEIEEKLGYYRQGVRRVIVEDDNLESQVAAAAKILIFRSHQLRLIRQQSLSQGTLQSFPLSEILRNALFEKKNLVIKLQKNGWSAKLRVYQGHLLDAIAGELSGGDALSKALRLKSGNFTVVHYEKEVEHASISTSLLGLLADSRFEENEVERFLVGIGSINPQFELSAIDDLKNLSEEEIKFTETIAQYPDFEDIMLYSPFSGRDTIEYITALMQKNIIQLVGEGKEIATFQAGDYDRLVEEFFSEETHEGKLIVFGLPGSGKSKLVRKIAGRDQDQIKSIQSLDFTRVKLKDNRALTVFGISIEEDFQPVLEKISEGMLGFVFLVDCNRPDAIEYSKYLLQQMMMTYSVPFSVGLTNMDKNDSDAVDVFRQKLDLPEGIEALPVELDSMPDLRQLLFNCRKVNMAVAEDDL